jgi:uncharacterized protein YegP (UPF0339 family)
VAADEGKSNRLEIQLMATTAYFKIVAASGGYRAHFYGGNNELVWWTEVYKTYQSAEQAVAFAQQNGSQALLYR